MNNLKIFIIGIAGGALVIFLGVYIARISFGSEMVKARDVALTSWNFVADVAVDKERIGSSGAWINRFECINGACVEDQTIPESRTYAPPALYIEGLRLLARATGNVDFEAEANSQVFRRLEECEANHDICMANFSEIIGPAVQSDKGEKLIDVFKEDLSRFPTINLPLWYQRVHNFVLLSGIMNKTEGAAYLGRAHQLFYDEFNEAAKRIGERVYEEGDLEVYAGSCWRPLAALKLYGASNDSTQLQEAISFVEAARLSSHAAGFDKDDITQGRRIHPGLTCTDVLVSLWEITGENSYLDEAHKLLQYFVSNNVDFPSRILASGDGAFVRIYSSGRIWKRAADTLSFVNLLLRMPAGTMFVAP